MALLSGTIARQERRAANEIDVRRVLQHAKAVAPLIKDHEEGRDLVSTR